MPHMLVYVAPATILIYYILASTISTCTLQGLKSRAHSAPYRTLQWLTVLVLISFVAEALMLLIDSIYNQARYSSTDSNVTSIFHRTAVPGTYHSSNNIFRFMLFRTYLCG